MSINKVITVKTTFPLLIGETHTLLLVLLPLGVGLTPLGEEGPPKLHVAICKIGEEGGEGGVDVVVTPTLRGVGGLTPETESGVEWVHGEGPRGEEGPTDKQMSLSRVPVPSGRLRPTLPLEETPDTACRNNEGERPVVTHEGHVSVPDTGDRPIDSWGRDGSPVLVFLHTSLPTLVDPVSTVRATLGVEGVEGGRDDTRNGVTDEEDAVWGTGFRADMSVVVITRSVRTVVTVAPTSDGVGVAIKDVEVAPSTQRVGVSGPGRRPEEGDVTGRVTPRGHDARWTDIDGRRSEVTPSSTPGTTEDVLALRLRVG